MLTAFSKLKASARSWRCNLSRIGKVRCRRTSTVGRVSPLNVLRGSLPTRSLLPKTSPLESKPAYLVKYWGDCRVRIVLKLKSRAIVFQLLGLVKMALPTKRCRASSAELARSARKLALSCGINTKLGLGPLSIECDQV